MLKETTANDFETCEDIECSTFLENNFHVSIDLKKQLNTSKIILNDLEENSKNSKLVKSKKRNSSSSYVNNNSNVSLLNNSNSFNLNDLKKLSSWNLPQTIIDEYEKKGITQMFDWQVNCLCIPKVLFENGNLIYSAPTSAGKTLVSEILMMKTIIERGKKALFILPFISVVREKMIFLQNLLSSSGYRVEGFYGGYTTPGQFETIDLAICTIEKANSIVNKLFEDNKLEDIGIIVIDEIHLISDPNRGYILELLLAKILFVCNRFQNYKIQIVAMSATISNCDTLKNWLNADSYMTNFRPVELNEMIKIGNMIYDNNMTFIRSIETTTVDDMNMINIDNDQDHIAQLCLETLLQKCSILIFCPSKDWCETLSTHIARSLHDLFKKTKKSADFEMIKNLQTTLNEKGSIQELKMKMKNLPTGLDTELEKSINYGCAFHHAGLTLEERDLIEMNFKNGILKVLVATSTLSSGVNLPARRVIIRSPLFCGKEMDLLTYRQMIGRAGRTGIDTIGESILICNQNNFKFGKELIRAELKPLKSCLGLENSIHLKRALLEIISLEAGKTKFDLEEFLKCTLFLNEISTNSTNDIDKVLNDCLEFLIEYEFIRLQENATKTTNENEELEISNNYISSHLGMACLVSSLPPTDGLYLLTELQKSRRYFVLESDLQAVYLVTPYSVCLQLQNLDWLLYLEIWEKLSPAMKKVGELLGIKESFLIKTMRGGGGSKNKSSDYKTLQIHKRFYIALALHDLVNEIPIRIVSKKYNLNRGLLQSLQQMASTFAGIVTLFCKTLNWNTLALIVSQFKERLFFGVHQDLIDLCRLSDINCQRARALFDAGITNLMELACSDRNEIERILLNCASFDTLKRQDFENDYEAKQRNDFQNFYITGNSKLSIRDASEKFINDARKFLEIEMKATNINWGTRDQKKTNGRISENTININENIEESNIAVNKTDGNIGKTKTVIENIKKSVEENSSTNQPEPSQNIIVIDKTQIENVPKLLNSSSFLIHSEQELNSSHILNACKNEEQSISFNSILIVDICGNKELFVKTISKISESKNIGFSIAIQKVKKSKMIIGGNIFKKNLKNKFDFMIDDWNFISGLYFSFGENVTYFLNMQQAHCENDNDVVIKEDKIHSLESILRNENVTLRMHNVKKYLKILRKVFSSNNIDIKCKIEDPIVADWLLQTDEIKNLEKLTKHYVPECVSLIDFVSSEKRKDSIIIENDHIKSSIQSCVCFHILNGQLENLSRIANGQLQSFFHTVEMPIQKSLTKMETIGMGVHRTVAIQLSENIVNSINTVETKLYEIHGIRSNLLHSRSNLATILGIKSNVKCGSIKDILNSVDDSPLCNLIKTHRKLTNTLNRFIPLIKCIKNNRIYGNSNTLTSTGRITMDEPNLQNVPKEFKIEIPDLVVDERVISCRRIFKTSEGQCLVSADYCQLEMRILAHLSQDTVLKMIMESNADVFISIAAKWNKINETEVSDDLRNNTKQICYGIIYGMGVKSLSESLKRTETEALAITKQFHLAYPGIQAYINRVIKFARENEYIETITGRRRYLKNINNHDAFLKSQAERQAINSTIQGSAADIVKSAILRMENNLIKYNKKLKQLGKNECTVHLVLHLHDELIFETSVKKSINVAKILKIAMENCVELNVPLKAKVKIGDSWGSLQEVFL